MRNTLMAFVLFTALGASACSKSEDANGASPPPTKTTANTTVVTPPAMDPDAKAKEIFAQRCTPCHGADGRGDGAASASLNPHPRNFHDADWQKSVTDDYLVQIIKMGGAAVNKSPAMPGNPDLKDDAVLKALAAYIRSMATQP